MGHASEVEGRATLLEAVRIDVLHRSGLLDSPPDEMFDRITRIAARAFNAPVAMVSLVDTDRQFFKSQVGLPPDLAAARGTPIESSLCQFVTSSNDAFVMSDGNCDPLRHVHPAVTDLGIRAYMGVPVHLQDLETGATAAIGSLCVIDWEPRTWTVDDLQLLNDLRDALCDELGVHHLEIQSDRAQQVNRFLADVIEQMAARKSPEDIISDACTSLLGFLADECYVSITDSDTGEVLTIIGDGPPVATPATAADRSLDVLLLPVPGPDRRIGTMHLTLRRPYGMTELAAAELAAIALGAAIDAAMVLQLG